jgi:hypothetical protein
MKGAQRTKGRCKNKHNLSVLGRWDNGNCKACDRDRKKRLKARKKKGSVAITRTNEGPPTWAIGYILSLGPRIDLAHGAELEALKMEAARLSRLPADTPPPPERLPI